jgi:hypothetical protein
VSAAHENRLSFFWPPSKKKKVRPVPATPPFHSRWR